VRDSRVANLTGFWTRNLIHPWNPELTLAMNAGAEKNRKQRPDLSRRLWGARVATTLQPIPKWSFGAGLSYQNSRYEREFAAGLDVRKDDYFALDLSATYALDRNWLIRSEYQRVEQQSTIGFFKYSRDSLAVKLRYDFK
jgi:predicted porin